MALPDEHRLRLRTQLGAAVRTAFRQFGDHAALVTRTNPLAAAGQVLGRDDVQQNLAAGMRGAETAAVSLVRAAWQSAGGPADSETLQSLVKDVRDAYSAASGEVYQAAREAFESVPARAFIAGESAPGSQPLMESAAERAHAVSTAVRAQSERVLVRNQASLDVAASLASTEQLLAEAAARHARGEKVMKRWHISRHQPEKACHWCRQLDGMTIPFDEEFPHGTETALPHRRTRHVATEAGAHRYRRPVGAAIIFTRPPAVYLGVLPGPPRHPHCRCWLEIIVLPSDGTQPEEMETPHVTAPQPYVRASDIAQLSESQYQGLQHFLSAAVHELDQVLRRLLKL
jgi:Phage Mu protein F like protein